MLDRHRSRPGGGARRGGRLPRRPDAADAARRARPAIGPGRARERERHARCASTSPTTCSAACSTASAARSTGSAPRRPRGSRPVEAAPPDPLERPPIDEPLSLGVRAIDALLPCGRGQRLGIFAGSGVGKSSLLGMIARCDVAPTSTSSPGRRARPRGARVHRARPRARGPGALRGGRRDLRPARARAHHGGVHGDDDRRVLPRPGPRRDADDGLGHALRDGPARDRPRRSASRRPRAAIRRRSSRCCRSCSSAPARRSAAPSPASTRCWSTATT